MGIDMTPDPRNPNINGGATCLTTGGKGTDGQTTGGIPPTYRQCSPFLATAWAVHRALGNFSVLVKFSTTWYEIQDAMMDEWNEHCRREDIDPDDETEQQLFFSYFTITPMKEI